MAQKKSTGPKRKSSGRQQAAAKGKATRGGTQPGKRSSTRKTSRTPARRAFSLNLGQKALIAGIGIIFITAVLVLSLLSPNQGQLTSALSNLMWVAFGWGGVLVPIITGATGLYLVLWGMDQPPEIPTYRILGFGLLFLTFEAFASMAQVTLSNGLADVWTVAQQRTGGGYLGGLLTYILAQAVGNVGAIFILVVIGIVGAILLSGLTRADISHFFSALAPSRSIPPPTATPFANRDILINPGRPPRQSVPPLQSNQVVTPEPQSPVASAARPAAPAAEPKSARERRSGGRQKQPLPKPEEAPTIVTPIFLGNSGRRGSQSWTLPALPEILEQGTEQDLSNAIIREQVEVIEHTLESFGAPATVVEINQGPTITQFGVEPNFVEMRSGKRTKVKVGKIASLADDLALALAARSIRIQAPVPGKGYVGIEVPNPAKALVSLRDVMEAPEFLKIKSPLRIGLGQDVAGQPIAADLSAMPHLLIAGTTGSGKSVLVNAIIACLLLQNTPDDLKIVMVDPKRVELTGYNGVPHLAAPVVVEMERVIGTLQWAMREMENRYKMFAEVSARNILDYNKKIKGKDKDPLAYIVIIIDELADLMMLSPEDTERGVTRLAQMARATGIHMVIATQRPSVDVVTGLIKANFPARIAFAVASGTDSRVILDTTGAERLLGQGDMLYQSPDAAAPLRLQGCFVSDRELNRLIEYWRGARRVNLIPAETSITPRPEPAPGNGETPTVAMAAAPTRRVEPVQQPLWEALQESETEAQYDDELLPEAIELVRKLNKASTSLLQRRFRIGYTRAARLIDIMAEQGVIGPPTGTSKARQVLLNKDAGETEGEEAEEEDDERESDA
jgi:S-DNA-T family DNA segregation ATPase FtsK/SpoIIIE